MCRLARWQAGRTARFTQLARDALRAWRFEAAQAARRCAESSVWAERRLLQQTFSAWRETQEVASSRSAASDQHCGVLPSVQELQDMGVSGIAEAAAVHWVHASRASTHSATSPHGEAFNENAARMPCVVPAALHSDDHQSPAQPVVSRSLGIPAPAATSFPDSRTVLLAWASTSRQRSTTHCEALRLFQHRRIEQCISRAFALWLRAAASKRQRRLVFNVCSRFATDALLRRAMASWQAYRQQPPYQKQCDTSNNRQQHTCGDACEASVQIQACAALSGVSPGADLHEVAAVWQPTIPRSLVLGNHSPLGASLVRLRALCRRLDSSPAAVVPRALVAPWQVHPIMPQHRTLLATLRAGTRNAQLCALEVRNTAPALVARAAAQHSGTGASHGGCACLETRCARDWVLKCCSMHRGFLL